MKKYTTYTLIITTQSNLHVGSGDTDFGPIDKKVQRDVLTKYPTIHSSSFKGALREYIEECTTGINAIEIFGSKSSEKTNRSNGKYRFYDAHLLAFPLRSSHSQYQLVVNDSIINHFNTQAELLKTNYIFNKDSTNEINNNISRHYTDIDENLMIEDILVERDIHTTHLKKISKNIFNNKLCIIPTKIFDENVDIPVIARNHLENGQSENLWYEESIPRETKFFTFISVPDNDANFIAFKEALENPNCPIQLGANASIGYGVCGFKFL